MKKCPKCNRIFSDTVSFCDIDGSLLKDSARFASSLIEKTIKDSYRITEKLAEGGMSVLYFAEQIKTGRKVVLKVFNEEYTRNEACVSKFRSEAMLAASLTHGNLIQVYDVDQDYDGLLFMAVEFLAGTDLKATIRKGPLEIPRAIRLSLQIADALGAAHQAGLVHRDLKPGNIMVVGKEEVKLMNFGIARLREAEELTRLTGVGTIFGTPAYMAPEQGEGGDIDTRTDIYSFGIILYELLTNVVPFRASTPAAVLLKHVKENPAPLKGLRPDIPAPLEHVVIQALEKKPDRRWAHIKEMAEALRKVESKFNRETPVDSLMTTQVLDVIWPQAARQVAAGEPLFTKPQSAIHGETHNTIAEQHAYLQAKNSEPSQMRQGYNQTIAIQSTMLETMALTQPMEAIQRKAQRWKWVGLGGGAIVASLLAVALGMFFYRQIADQKEQIISTGSKAEPTSSAKKQIVAVAVNADKTILTLRELAEVALRVQYADGKTEELRDKQFVQWASSDPSIVVANQDGKIEGRGIGRAAVTARYKGMETPAITIVVTGPSPLSGVAQPALVSLIIQGGKKEINTKGRLLLRVMGKNSDGREIEIKDGVQWESSDKRIATVNPKGEVIGQREGSVDIVARYANIASKPLSLVIKALAKRQDTQAVRGLSSERISEINTYIRAAKSYRDRGAYAEALVALQEAGKIDPSNKEVQSEIAITRRACNAERTLGRSELKC